MINEAEFVARKFEANEAVAGGKSVLAASLVKR